jgi:hypothetical protein
MSRPSPRLTGASLAGLLLVLAACGARGNEGPPRPAPVPDGALRQGVEARLAAEPWLPPGSVRVEVSEGQVILHGSVAGLAAWQCVLRTAAMVEGVLSVSDYLVIGPGPRTVDCRAPRAVPPP